MMIEHSMWTRLSEADIVRGSASGARTPTSIGQCATFFADIRVCDPAPFAFSTARPVGRL